ncbi:PREDICTED: mitotic spindle assembly checkpoint protein MAD2A-like [Priapulus caudatus]|uniref:Mitotic spindle assembly checkpoint protein MAD2A-like n=1 Tax=Priapulus caudatus TaxID=37621 RepID=A0ABM1F138_PRICU|nr:PREDICTED: mitotic spindle assembly checkpoint protein MAD2A-like [Priapulus caudatus]
MTSDTDLVAYLSGVMKQIREWLAAKVLQRMVVVITRVDTQETLERWQFDIDTDKTVTDDSSPRSKPLKEIQKEIRDVIRQITASVTFLPLLDCPCSFNILIYTDKESEVPESFEESGRCFIANSQEVRLRSSRRQSTGRTRSLCYTVDD